MSKDIAVKFTNATNKTDFSVIVYTANLYVSNESDTNVSIAYEVLRTQTSVTFVHPASFAVSATYRKGGQSITAGPIPALPGNKYEIIRESETDIAVIREVPGYYKRNYNGAITITNKPPTEWPGQLFTCQLQKGGRTILLQPDVRSGNEAVFILEPVLKFAVTRNIYVSTTFLSLELSQNDFVVNLENYPNGVEVIVTEEPGGLYYNFTARTLLYS